MSRRNFLFAAFALLVGAAIFFYVESVRKSAGTRPSRPGFVSTRGSQFVIDGKPFRFVGANATITYGDDERQMATATLRTIADSKVRVVRVWAFGESGPGDNTPAGVAQNDALRLQPFRRGPDDWNEGAFENLDRIIAEAARLNMYVEICLANWWRDTGGVVRYLDWVGIKEAKDDTKLGGINVEKAMLFYRNEEVRRLYREHVKRIVTRRNTVTGMLYRDDPSIFGYELINEGQATPGRWGERRIWIVEMSQYLRSLDPDHLIAPGTWGYRTSLERREWILDHRLASVDFCNVHLYPDVDRDSFVDKPSDLSEFVENRASAAYATGKPLVIGEFGVPTGGFNGLSQSEWYRAYFESAAQSGVSGAFVWVFTQVLSRNYGITSKPRDDEVRSAIRGGADLLESLRNETTPSNLRDDGRHLVPRQFAFTREINDPRVVPQITKPDIGIIKYGFKPESVLSERFEKIGGGDGYIWGAGIGFLEFRVPPREDWRRIGRIIVRAHLKPVPPDESNGRVTTSRVTLIINGKNCGSRLIPVEEPPLAQIEEWVVESWWLRFSAMRGKPLSIRFEVEADADQPFGVNISNWPDGYDAKGAFPVEVELTQ
jgi:mannan endo-1,4-beta-mannosidase